MKNENTTATADVVAIKPTRKKAPETVLKQEMASLNKELVKVNKTIAEFEDITKAKEAADVRKVEIEANLEQVKADLRKALGLD